MFNYNKNLEYEKCYQFLAQNRNLGIEWLKCEQCSFGKILKINYIM